MKIRYLSDLHLEFIKPDKMQNFIRKIPVGCPGEICILAGDIGNPYQPNYDTFMKYISENFKKTFVIAGNHEYYSKVRLMDETSAFLKEYFKKFDNISYLDNSYEVYEGHCFVGTTLWSKVIKPTHTINDVYDIPGLDYVQYNKLNMTCVNFLEDTLKINNKCIIITHHMPSSSLIDAKYKTPKMDPYNQWFYCDMDDFVEKNKSKILCWIYGHTHTPSNKIIHNIPFLCNPIGYPNENVKLDFGATIDI